MEPLSAAAPVWRGRGSSGQSLGAGGEERGVVGRKEGCWVGAEKAEGCRVAGGQLDCKLELSWERVQIAPWDFRCHTSSLAAWSRESAVC